MLLAAALSGSWMAALLAASLVVLATAAGAYWFAYRLYSQAFFLWITLAWVQNAIYLVVEEWVVGASCVGD